MIAEYLIFAPVLHGDRSLCWLNDTTLQAPARINRERAAEGADLGIVTRILI